MNRHGIALLVLSIIAIAVWTYHVNYNTKTALERISDLRRDIAAEREALQVLRVEWAYLNTPERLDRLVREHNRHLGLAPMTPASLGHAAAVPYPTGDALDADDIGALAQAIAGQLALQDHGETMPMPVARPAGWSAP